MAKRKLRLTVKRKRLRVALTDAVEPSLRDGTHALPAWEVEEEIRRLWRWLTKHYDVQRPLPKGR